jgi:hypothetical protein
MIFVICGELKSQLESVSPSTLQFWSTFDDALSAVKHFCYLEASGEYETLSKAGLINGAKGKLGSAKPNILYHIYSNSHPLIYMLYVICRITPQQQSPSKLN